MYCPQCANNVIANPLDLFECHGCGWSGDVSETLAVQPNEMPILADVVGAIQMFREVCRWELLAEANNGNPRYCRALARDSQFSLVRLFAKLLHGRLQ